MCGCDNENLSEAIKSSPSKQILQTYFDLLSRPCSAHCVPIRVNLNLVLAKAVTGQEPLSIKIVQLKRIS